MEDIQEDLDKELTPPMLKMEAPDAPALVDEVDRTSVKVEDEEKPRASPSKVVKKVVRKVEEPPFYLDDVDRMLCHEDFPSLLALAVRVKQVREALMSSGGVASQPKRTASEMDPQQVINAVTRMQQQHLLRNYETPPVIRRGTYHLTDSLLNENFHILQQEMERCTKLIERAQEREALEKKKAEEMAQKKKTKADGDAIAVKYAKWQTDILMNWMLEHINHPFPNSAQIDELSERTGLSHGQVVNWTTNVRKRSLKATVEKKKKPHHFLDFAFLANDREKKDRERRMMESQRSPPVPNVTTGATPYVMANTPGGPYSNAIGKGAPPLPHRFPHQQHAPSPKHFQAHPPASHYGVRPQNILHQPGYQPFPAMGQPQAFPQLPPHGIPHMPDARQDMDSKDSEWERKLQAVSESFDDSEGSIPDTEFCSPEGDDPLLAFVRLWGASAGDNDMGCVKETHDGVLDMDVGMEDIHQPNTNQSMQHGKEKFGATTWPETTHQEGPTEELNGILLHGDPFPPFHEVPGEDSDFRQGRLRSFSFNMEEFDNDLDMDTEMDVSDFLVQGV